MIDQQIAFQINEKDNVATALSPIIEGQVHLRGDSLFKELKAVEEISVGHKIAIKDIKDQEEIIKYGIVIGRATAEILKGSWVHLHCMKSVYDERSSHLNTLTGTPTDTKYE